MSFIRYLIVALLLQACLSAEDVNKPAETVANAAPKAIVTSGSDFPAGAFVEFNASNSFDPDGDELSFQWSVKAPGIAPPVTGAGPSVSVRLDTLGEYAVSLTVADPRGATDSTTIRVGAVEPEIAVSAGQDKTVPLFEAAALEGSVDLQGTPNTSFYWILESAPEFSTVGLLSDDTLAPTFTPDMVGDYVWRLTVESPWSRDESSVKVTATTDQYEVGTSYRYTEYSRPLDRLIGISHGQSAVRILTPGTWTTEQVAVSRPIATGLSADGTRLALLHGETSDDASIIDLVALAVTQTFTDVFRNLDDVTLAGDSSHLMGVGPGRVSSIDLDTEALVEAVTTIGTWGRTIIQANPSGTKFYSWSFFGDPGLVTRSESAASGMVFLGLHSVGSTSCKPLWPSATGDFVLSACGQVLQVSDDPTLDLNVLGSINTTGVKAAVHVAQQNLIVVVALDGPRNALKAFNDTTYELEWTRILPDFYFVDTSPHVVPIKPDFLFVNSSGTHLVLVGSRQVFNNPTYILRFKI